MTQRYLILHRVRGEPAYDIAIKLCDNEQAEPCQSACGMFPRCKQQPWWIIPTSGHRAYPFRVWELDELETEYERPVDIEDLVPNTWGDHY